MIRTASAFFSPEEQKLLVDAIARAEEHTSGEIRLHVQNFCFGNAVEKARKKFVQLGMHSTKERNGVLFFLAVMSHKLAVVGDEGIHQKLGAPYWDKMVNGIISGFHKEKRAESLAEAILECGKQLGTYFPRAADDRDELTNTISFK